MKNVVFACRSSAVVTYSASKYPAFFSHLAPQTNLNLAPSNWLRSAPGLRPDSLLSGKRSKSAKTEVHNVAQFSSLSMADSHIRIMDQIDVVSDAEVGLVVERVNYQASEIFLCIDACKRGELIKGMCCSGCYFAVFAIILLVVPASNACLAYLLIGL